MVELTPTARKIYDALLQFGAKSDTLTKSADQIMTKVKMGKGLINQGLQELLKKKIVKRISKSKRAGYFICQEV